MLTWTLERKDLPLKVLWKISRGSLSVKEAYFVSVSDGSLTTSGEVSPNTRYGNTPDVIQHDFALFQKHLKTSPPIPETPLELEDWLDAFPICNTLRFGIESALIRRLAKLSNQSVPKFLDLDEPTPVPTCYSIPIMEPGAIAEYLKPLARFQSIKVKVDADSARDILRQVIHHTSQTGQRIRIDGNEAWKDTDSFLQFAEDFSREAKSSKAAIDFIEQPLPAGLASDYVLLKSRSPFLLMADESIEDQADFSKLTEQFHAVNIKLMKTGGMIRAIRLLREAHDAGMGTMLGCMIETSLGISSALHLSSLADYIDLDGFLLLKEDPYHYAEEKNGDLYLT